MTHPLSSVEINIKNMRLVILFDMFHNPSFKMMTCFNSIARTAANASKFIY